MCSRGWIGCTKGIPWLRAACTVFMRDVAAYLATLDIVRGSPSIYVTWPGYDEVAHHSGPWSSDAFGTLKRYDQVIRQMHRFIREKAPRPYDLILLSDHGQSFGATFKQRYGFSLKEFIEQQLPAGTTVSEHIGGDTGITSLAGLSGELDNVQQQGVGGRVGGAVVKQGQKAAAAAVKESEGAAEAEPRPRSWPTAAATWRRSTSTSTRGGSRSTNWRRPSPA